MFTTDETIAAIATPVGPGGIGIIKISGTCTGNIIRRIFRPAKNSSCPPSHHLIYGNILDPVTSEIVDEVLLSFMKSPHTYTREDVAEINCHSGYIILQKILSIVLSCGARLAYPGEFTKRAFLNGRIDLTQAEAVIEVINAQTAQALRMANEQLRGVLFDKINNIRDCLVDTLSHIEVAIDFPEEDSQILRYEELTERLKQNACAPVAGLLASYGTGRVYREGASVALVGRPNVGKSSLLNALLQEQRAIVTDIPGTTRDIIEETVNVNGIPIRLIDTAGLRKAENKIEEIGIGLTRKSITNAELVLFLVDGSNPLTSEDYQELSGLEGKSLILVINKMDLGVILDPEVLKQEFSPNDLVIISALKNTNMNQLKECIFSSLIKHDSDFSTIGTVPNARHQAALVRSASILERIVSNMEDKISPDLLAVDMQEVLEILGEITGKTTPEDVLERIFTNFCIGK